jgi:RimJ/RimL family protein N-acetyltransferase
VIVVPVTLVGRRLRMEPLGERHFESLWKHSEPEMFQYMSFWWAAEDREQFFHMAAKAASKPGAVPLAMVLQESGEAVGSSTFFDIRPEHRSLEVGATWISPQFQRSFVNPEAKLLMLQHAFETLGCIRVQLKTDSRNIQSQRAMEKLGCKKEGVLRNHMILADGHYRDSVYYSIIESEWPQVKQSLLDRIG